MHVEYDIKKDGWKFENDSLKNLVVAIHTIFEKGVSRKTIFKVSNRIFSYEMWAYAGIGNRNTIFNNFNNAYSERI